MKKTISIIMAVVMLFCMSSIGVSATCGFGHGDRFLDYTCSGIVSEVKNLRCHWAGRYGGGIYHGTDCQIIQTYRYTTEFCTAPGCTHNIQNGQHLCEAQHTQADMYVDVCPY